MVYLKNLLLILILIASSFSVYGKPVKGLNKANFDQFYCTQKVAGFDEIERKYKKIKDLDDSGRKEYYIKNAIPVVLGIDDKMYLIDHHHFLAAAYRYGKEKPYFKIVGDFSDSKDENEFWKRMKENKWVYLRDNGKDIEVSDLPKHVKDLVDDPYRTFSAQLRNAGAYDKTKVPYAEFMWADYYRLSIPLTMIKKNYDMAVKLAMTQSASPNAAHLPGYKPKLCLKIYEEAL